MAMFGSRQLLHKEPYCQLLKSPHFEYLHFRQLMVAAEVPEIDLVVKVTLPSYNNNNNTVKTQLAIATLITHPSTLCLFDIQELHPHVCVSFPVFF